MLAARMLILGSGPAGLTAAIYGARAGLSPLVIEGLEPGGQMTTTTDVENYPGFADIVQGPWLMEQMRAQAAHVGTRFVQDHIVDVDLSERPFRAIGDGGGAVYTGETLLIATGAQAKWLGLPSEQRLVGKGVSACATCDGFFQRGKKVAVIGGGDSAVQDALYMTAHTSHVTLIHRRDRLRAEQIMQERLFANSHIDIRWNTVVDDFKAGGEPEGLAGLELRNLTSGATEDLDVDGAFVAIGHTPASALFRNRLQLDADGYVETAPRSTRTSIPGVFACGDVADRVYRQAVTAAGSGCMAALDAVSFLADADFAAARQAQDRLNERSADGGDDAHA